MFAKPEPFPGNASLARISRWTGLVAFLGFLIIGLATRVSDHPALVIIGMVAALTAGVPLIILRPRFALGFAAVASVGVALVDGSPSDLGWFALIVLAIWCVLSGGILVGLIFWAGSVLLLGGEWLWAVRDPGWGNWIIGTTLSALATSLVRHELVLVERLRVAQTDLAERSRLEERNRIARELHDVIAHCLTVSLLHVSSARVALDHDPADAARSLVEAERLGRQSLDEVRVTMGLLRERPAKLIATPVPGADQLPDLVEQLRRAGADVSLVVDGKMEMIPSTTGATIFRIVQESLTNAAKHAPKSIVQVRVAIGHAHVDVSVESHGPPGRGRGLGLSSMRERAEAVGGSCSAGPGGGGWLVHASLPVRSESSQDLR